MEVKLRHVPLTFLILALLGFILYSNTFRASFHFDDWTAVAENPAIRDPSNLRAIWDAFNTRVVAGLSFALNYALGGLNVFGYHLFNITCHILSSFFVYVLVVLTFQTPAMKGDPLQKHSLPIACFASLLFLVHPIQTQAVNYIWQRVTSLAAFFYLVSVVLYVKAKLASRVYFYLASLLAAFLGMFTKEIAFTIPFTIALYEFSFFGPQSLKKRSLLLLPFFLTLVMIPITLTRSSQVTLKLMRSPSLTAPSAEGRTFPEVFSNMTKWYPSKVLSRKNYLLTELNVLRTYLRLLFLPFHQNVDYHYPISSSFTEPKTFGSFLLLLTIFLSAVKLFERHRLIAFSIFWFFLTLTLESLVVLPDVLFEHRLYLPMVGFSIFLPASLFLSVKDPKKFIAVSAALVLAFSIATYRRNRIWKDEMTLWQDVVKKSPKKGRPYNNLGWAYGKKGDYDKEIEYCTKAIQLNPKLAEAYNNVGFAYGEKGDYDKQIEYCQKAIDLDPVYFSAYNNLGVAYGKKGSYDKALECSQKALQLNPAYAQAYNNLGIVYGKRGEVDQEIKYYEKAIQSDPGYAKARYNLGSVYLEQGDYDKAIEQLQKAIELDSEYTKAHSNLGIAYREKGDTAGLQRQIERLRRLNRSDLAAQLEEEK